jgi:hypothetical protein
MWIEQMCISESRFQKKRELNSWRFVIGSPIFADRLVGLFELLHDAVSEDLNVYRAHSNGRNTTD